MLYLGRRVADVSPCPSSREVPDPGRAFAYSVTNTNAKNMIKNCASSPEKYFDPPSNAALVASFNQIAAELRNLYLSK